MKGLKGAVAGLLRHKAPGVPEGDPLGVPLGGEVSVWSLRAGDGHLVVLAGGTGGADSYEVKSVGRHGNVERTFSATVERPSGTPDKPRPEREG